MCCNSTRYFKARDFESRSMKEFPVTTSTMAVLCTIRRERKVKMWLSASKEMDDTIHQELSNVSTNVRVCGLYDRPTIGLGSLRALQCEYQCEGRGMDDRLTIGLGSLRALQCEYQCERRGMDDRDSAH